MADSEKLINTKINVDTSDAEKEIAKLTRDIEALEKEIEKKRKPHLSEYELVGDLEAQAEKVDKNSRKFEELADMIDASRVKLQSFEDQSGITELMDQVGLLQGKIYDIRQNEIELAKAAQKAADSMKEQVPPTEDTAKNADQAARHTQQLDENARNAVDPFEKLGNRLARMVRNIFFFNLIGRALRSVVSYFGEVLAANEQWQQATAELRGALQTLAQPLITAVLPVLLTILQVITAIISHIASVLSLFFGTSLGASAKAAQQIGAGMATGAKNAEKMRKSLQGFDELNVLNDNESSSGGGVGGVKGGAASFNFADGIKKELLRIEALALGAMLALGLLLLFFGGPAQWPLALGLIAAAVLGWVGLVTNGDIAPELKQKLLDITAMASVFSLALGLLLLFFGGPNARALGMGLILAGALALAAIAKSSDTISPEIKQKLLNLTMIASVSALALGLILLFTGANVRLGLGLIAAGAAGIASVLKFTDWGKKWASSFKKTLSDVKANFKKFIDTLKKWWADWTNGLKTEWENVKSNIRAGIDAIKAWWQGWTAGLKQEWSNTTNHIRSAWDAVKTFFQTTINNIKSWFINTWNAIWQKINEIFGKIKTGTKTVGDNIKTYIIDKVKAIADVFGGVKSTVDTLGQKLKDVFNQKYKLTLETNEIRNVSTAISEVIAPSGKYKLMAMASGGVIPPNREFLTLLGDNKTEPEVVSPLSTMQQAMVQALQQAGYGGNGQTIQVNVDGRKLFEVMVNQNNSAVKRTGSSPLLV